jgi:hypothetical protein
MGICNDDTWGTYDLLKISGSWCNNEDIIIHYILPKVNYNMDVGVNDIKVDSCKPEIVIIR